MKTRNEYLLSTYDFPEMLNAIMEGRYTAKEASEYLIAYFERLNSPIQLTDEAIARFLPNQTKIVSIYPNHFIQLETQVIIQPTAKTVFGDRELRPGNGVLRTRPDKVCIDFYNTTDSIPVELTPSTILYLNARAIAERGR